MEMPRAIASRSIHHNRDGVVADLASQFERACREHFYHLIDFGRCENGSDSNLGAKWSTRLLL
jgi:hypothetical protein